MGTKDPHTLKKEAIRMALLEMAYEAVRPMTSAQISAAQGTNYLMARQKKGGKFVHLTEELAKAIASGADQEHESIEVWAERPSTPAFVALMDRTIDKPVERLDADVSLDAVIRWKGEK